MADEDHLAKRLLRGLEQLRNGRAAEAIAPLLEVADDPELAKSPDLADVRARALSLLAQAYLETNQVAQAKPRIDAALSIAPPSDDRKVLVELAGRIDARLELDERSRVQSERLAAMPVEEIESRSRDPRALVEVLVRKANAEVDVGRSEAAVPIAERAVVDAMTLGDVRLEILARLSLARATPDVASREIERALRSADAFGDPNLITTVVKAAKSHGVPLPTERGPWESDA
ncbi:MAG: hypothetical protein AAGA48_05230 [Myxococcota bacterium]